MENLLSAKRILNFNFKAKVFAVATVAFVGLVLAVRQPGWLSGGKNYFQERLNLSVSQIQPKKLMVIGRFIWIQVRFSMARKISPIKIMWF